MTAIDPSCRKHGAERRLWAALPQFAVPTSLAAAGGCEPMGVDRGGAQAEATGCFITTDREITCSPLLAVLAMQELPDRLGNLIGSGRRTLGWHQLVRIDLGGGAGGGGDVGSGCCWWWWTWTWTCVFCFACCFGDTGT